MVSSRYKSWLLLLLLLLLGIATIAFFHLRIGATTMRGGRSLARACCASLARDGRAAEEEDELRPCRLQRHSTQVHILGILEPARAEGGGVGGRLEGWHQHRLPVCREDW